MYQQKSTEHLNLAYKTYEEQIYKGDFKNDEVKKSALILARLEDLAGNDQPLKDFYRTLRQERKDRQEKAIAQMIREQQEARKKQEAEKQKAEKQKADKVKAERLQQNLAMTKKQAQDLDSIPSAESVFEPKESMEKDLEKTVEKTPKVKKRGEPFPLPILEIKEDNIIIKEQPIITLSSTNYYLFQSLIGEVYNRNISRKEVETLLTAEGPRARLRPVTAAIEKPLPLIIRSGPSPHGRVPSRLLSSRIDAFPSR